MNLDVMPVNAGIHGFAPIQKHLRPEPMSPKTLLRAAIRRAGYDLHRIQRTPPFVPYCKHYDLDYGRGAHCSFDFWIANKAASQWYDEWFFSAADPVWELRQFCQLVRPGDNILEIGCHHGFLTMQLAHLIGPSGTIVALDANPENVIIAQANVALNRLSNVQVLFAAAGERAGVSQFVFRTNAHQVVRGASESAYQVETVTADSLAERFSLRFNVMKVDVEGFECEVLRGARAILSEKPALILETHPLEMRQWHANGSIAELMKLIDAASYEGTMVCRPNFAEVSSFGEDRVPLDRVSNLHLRLRCQ